MKIYFRNITAILVIMTILAAAQTIRAATPNPLVVTSGYTLLPIQISGQYAATTASVATFKLPWPYKLLYVGATARASGGTSPTLTVDVKLHGVSVLSSAMSITAGTITDGTISTPELSDEGIISVDLTIGGTSPTWSDITVFLAAKRQ